MSEEISHIKLQDHREKVEPLQFSLEAPLTVIRLEDIHDVKAFLTTTIPKDKLLQCTIRRHKSGFDFFRPQYDLHLSAECSLLMSAKKKGGTSDYYFSLDKEDFEYPSKSYIGRVKGNYAGTIFFLLD